MSVASGLNDEARAALEDAAEVTLSVVGRNGFRFEYRVAVRDWERGEVGFDLDEQRRTLDVFYPGDQHYTEPIPYHRRFTFTLDAQVPGVTA